MRLLWSESPNVVDKIIKLVTGEDCGHFAILFESVNGTGVIFESNLLGTHPSFYNTWIKNRNIVHQMDFTLDAATEDKLWDVWVSNFDGRGYDFLGCIYCGMMKLRYRLFKIPVPKVNKWAKSGAYFCDVIYQIVAGMPGIPAMPVELNEMSSPHDVWLFLKANQDKLTP